MSACRQFILNFVKKMHKTIPYKLLKSLSCLDTGGFSSITVNDIKHLHETFHSPDVDIDNLARDTRKLLCNPPRLDLGVVEFWTHVCRMFPDSFGLFLPKILCLPNSNASTERVFSLLKAVHTPVRNSLKACIAGRAWELSHYDIWNLQVFLHHLTNFHCCLMTMWWDMPYSKWPPLPQQGKTIGILLATWWRIRVNNLFL